MEDVKQTSNDPERGGNDLKEKRDNLEKALNALSPNEMETIVGGLSKNAKLALQIGGAAAATLLVAGGAGAAAYFGAKSGATVHRPKRPMNGNGWDDGGGL